MKPRTIFDPIPKADMQRILQYDADAGFGPSGRQPNRNRFYIWLVAAGSDIQLRTVAVKAKTKKDRPVVKEVTRAAVSEPLIYVRDLILSGLNSYHVDWSPEKFTPPGQWFHYRHWETTPYTLRGPWKLNAHVINPELIRTVKPFRYAAWKPSCGHILDYLKTFAAHPEIEHLAKAGLERYSTKIALIRKIKTCPPFRSWFLANLADIRRNIWPVPVILKAYTRNISLSESNTLIASRRKWSGQLPAELCPVASLAYIEQRNISQNAYALYIRHCSALGLDLTDTKTIRPRRFKIQYDRIAEQLFATERLENAAKTAAADKKIEEYARRYRHLETSSGILNFILPRSTADLQKAGKLLSNCLSSPVYASRIADGKSLILLITCANHHVAAAEYNLQTAQLTQCYGPHNSPPPPDVKPLVQTLISRLHLETC